MVRLSSLAGCVLALDEGRRTGHAAAVPRPQPAGAAIRSAGRGGRSASRTSCCSPAITQRFGDHPDARGVFDLDSVQLLWTARTMRDQGQRCSRASALKPPPALADRRRREPVRAAARAFAPSGSARKSPRARSSCRRNTCSTSRASRRGCAQRANSGSRAVAAILAASDRSARCARSSACSRFRAIVIAPDVERRLRGRAGRARARREHRDLRRNRYRAAGDPRTSPAST